jgi:hypothetical protein
MNQTAQNMMAKNSFHMYNNVMCGKIFTLTILLSLLYYGNTFSQTEAFPDTGNCLYCHRYPQMGRFDEKGKKRIFYINEKMYANSVHGKLRCKSCHIGLDQTPHINVQKVDCSTKCHIEEPSTSTEFSHKNMIDKYESSVHGKGTEKNPKPFSEDLPTCKYCHNNRLYNPFMNVMGQSEALLNETMTRCLGCHTQQQWAERYFSHFTHRMKRRRSQTEIIALCTGCHEDREKMTRHGLETIETYKDTFHWALVKYQVENAPDCISCHVPLGFSTHHIRPKEDPTSPVHMANRVMTCSNQGGMQKCHPGATKDFSSGRVHAYGTKIKLQAKSGSLMDRDTNVTTPTKDSAETGNEIKEVYHYTVLKLIKLFYKVLIAVVIGTMFIHQLLDYVKTKKNHTLH